MILKHFKTVVQANKSPSHKDEGRLSPRSPSSSAGGSRLLPPAPPSPLPKDPRRAQKSRKDGKNSLEKVGMPNYHSLISAFSCKQFKKKQSKTHQRYHKPSGCLLKKRKALSSARHKGLHGNSEFRPPLALFMQHFITKGPSHYPAQQILIF